MCKTTISKITLVGAGPGDPDLITVKGLKAIQSADVILYDALINKQILENASKHAIKVFVGKRANRHYKTQDEINILMVQYALMHGHVVRLKGGDPFVFGRGQEEKAFAEQYGIPTEVIPGISSSISVPASQGIPVTSRGLSESFWVMTGTTKSGKLSKDIEVAAQSTATVIILMGINKLAQITEKFIFAGKIDTPAMVIQNGTKQNEKYAIGTVGTIVEAVKEQEIGTPGIIIIGDVVSLHHRFSNAPADKTLFHKHLLTTASR
ncbi:MAG: uroporphyrinogen-III C-methyltransferase [Bacteroidota bacterium]